MMFSNSRVFSFNPEAASYFASFLACRVK